MGAADLHTGSLQSGTHLERRECILMLEKALQGALLLPHCVVSALQRLT